MALLDNRVYRLLTELSACLCAQVSDEANGLSGVCFCGVIPGDAAVMDYADNCEGDVCGMAYVRLVSAYPAETPNVLVSTPGNCGKQLGLDIEMGLLRCFSAGLDETAALPTEAEMLEAAQTQFGDMFALIRAVSCCDLLPDSEYVLGPYTPAGPMGGVYGGTITLAAVV
jgi:hypothetical protein